MCFMELFEELLFTVSLSLVVSLLVARLFSASASASASDCDVRTLSESKGVTFEEKNCTDSVAFGNEIEDDFRCSVEAAEVCKPEEEEAPRVRQIDQKTVAPEIEEVSAGGNVCENVPNGELEKEERETVGGGGGGGGEELMGSREARDSESGGNFVNEEEGLLDDWEGIERTELERGFGKAVAFVGSESNADSIDSNVKLQLYGLHKIATEGSCCEPQPMTLKLSSRANWNAWKRLGNISPEDAMEQYIALLYQNVPDWTEDPSDFLAVGTSWKLPPNQDRQPGVANKRESEQLKSCIEDYAAMEV